MRPSAERGAEVDGATKKAAILPRLGALERWREEIRAGQRKNDCQHFDGLAAAAANEATAREVALAGDLATARRFIDRARLRLENFWGDPGSDHGKAILRQLGPLTVETLAGGRLATASTLPADWSTVPSGQGWR